jgi:hypothetical protein
VSLLNAFRQRLRVNCEAVVHGDDLDLAGRMILDRMVGAVVALMHLLCLCTEGEAQHLVAEADAEDRDVGLDQLLDDWHGIFAGSRRVARAVRQKDAIRLHGKYIFGARRRRHHRDLAVETGKKAQDIALDAVIEADDVILGVAGPEFAVALVPHPRCLRPL